MFCLRQLIQGWISTGLSGKGETRQSTILCASSTPPLVTLEPEKRNLTGGG